jgi:hypothetical protein
MIPAPRSLGGRAFVLIALLIVVSLAAGVILFCQAERTPLVQQLAQMVVAVNLTRLSYDSTPRAAVRVRAWGWPSSSVQRDCTAANCGCKRAKAVGCKPR